MKLVYNRFLLSVYAIMILVSIESCSQIGSVVPATPVVTSIIPATDTIGQTITITGSNFTNAASVTINGLAATNIVVTGSSQITCTVTGTPGVAVDSAIVIVSVGTFASSAGTTISILATGPAPIDGYSSSGQVASNNLIGYWPFDGSVNEQLHNAAPILSGGAYSFVAGRIGQAIQFTNGWLTYPNTSTAASYGTNPSNNNDTLNGGFTLSMWVQLPDTNLLTNLFQLSHSNVPNYPLLGLAYRKHADKTVDMDGGITNLDSTGTHSTYAGAFTTFLFKDSSVIGGSKWTFLAMVYDTINSAHHLSYFANGVLLTIINLDSLGAANPADWAFPNGGSLQMLCANAVPTGNWPTIGTFESSTTTPGDVSNNIPSFMSSNMNAVLDDIRLFNINLPAQNISDLYNLGMQGR